MTVEQNLKTVLMDLKAIIDALDHVIEVENYHIELVINKNSIVLEKYRLNISLAIECKECLNFVIENLPMLNSRYDDLNAFGYSPRKLQSVMDIGKYRTEITKAKRVIETSVWAAKHDSNYANRELPAECMKKLEAAYKSLIKIKV